ncbi:MAG: hypothetical protein AAF701_09490, partial [Pseudomonadota bacterium]
MKFTDIKSYLTWGRAQLGQGPHAILFAEDDVELTTTIQHHVNLRFQTITVIGCDVPFHIIKNFPDIIFIDLPILPAQGLHDIINDIIPITHGSWVYYGFNAEYFYYPFSETRSAGELAHFLTEERREAILTYVIDLYAPDLKEHPIGVDYEYACLDRTGYYALARTDKWDNMIDRQLNFYGGLRWRFEEHVPPKR